MAAAVESKEYIPTFVVTGNGFEPIKGTEFSAGWDLITPKDFVIPPGERATINLEVYIAAPPGTYARFAPRSGLAHKFGINVLAGVIDRDYRKPTGLILHNTDMKTSFEAKRGDRVGQVIFEKNYEGPVIIHRASDEAAAVALMPRLDSSRVGGFGSTGVSGAPTPDLVAPVEPSPSP